MPQPTDFREASWDVPSRSCAACGGMMEGALNLETANSFLENQTDPA